MDTDLDGLTAVVVGGTSGIGRAVAESLDAEGADAVPTSRTESSVEEACEAVGCDLVQPADVTDRASVEALFERVADAYGGVDLLVNSAGVVPEATPAGEVTDEVWHQVVETNLYGAFLASTVARRHIDEGAILNVSSMNGVTPVSGLSPYGASKFGLNGLTKYLALEFAPEVRVNAIAPGYVVTRQNREQLEDDDLREAIHRRTPLGRYADLGEVADAATFLASPAASFVTGEVFVVDGGFSLK